MFAARMLLRLIVRPCQAAPLMGVEERALRRCCELCVPRGQRHYSRRGVDRLGGIDVVLHARLRRDGLEHWGAALADVGRREPLVLRNDALMRRRVIVVIGHQVCCTMLPTASSSSKSELRRGSSSLAVLFPPWVILFVRNKRMIILLQSVESGLNSREVLILLRTALLALIVLLKELDLLELRASIRSQHAHV